MMYGLLRFCEASAILLLQIAGTKTICFCRMKSAERFDTIRTGYDFVIFHHPLELLMIQSDNLAYLMNLSNGGAE